MSSRAGSDWSPLRSRTMPSTTSSSSCQTRWPWASSTSRPWASRSRHAPHHVAEAGLVAHHHALPARRRAGPQRSAFDHVVDAHRDVVGGAEHDLADLADAAFFLGPEVIAGGDGVFHAHRGFHGVLAHAQQPQRADHVGGAALDDVVAPDVGIVRGDRVLELLQGDAVALHPRRVGMDLVAFDGPAEAGHVGHAAAGGGRAAPACMSCSDLRSLGS